MINILLPLVGKSTFFDSPQYRFPKPLIEITGKPMIQLAVDNLGTIDDEKHFIFVIAKGDCVKYHLDDVLQLLSDSHAEIIKLDGQTRGAACSALMAIDHVNNDIPLIISNADQIFDEDLNKVIRHFRKENADAGVICFESVHPRWSYVRLDEKGLVIETAEKRPLSKHAIAGFYYFKKGKDFVEAAMRSIYKDARVDDKFYTAPVLNELVLDNKKVLIFQVDNAKYHTFYSPQKIAEYVGEQQ